MPEIITCPGCKRNLRLPEVALSQVVQCPSCQAQFPAAEARPALPPNLAVTTSALPKDIPTLERYHPGADRDEPRRRPSSDRRPFSEVPLAKKRNSVWWLIGALVLIGGVLFAGIGVLANTLQARKPVAAGKAFPPQRVANDGGRVGEGGDADLDLLGMDANGCYLRGEALREQKRFPEAARAYRRSLDLNPKYANAYQGLLNSLGGDADLSDVGPRFAKLNSRRANFDVLAAGCEQRQFPELLEPLAQTMRDLDPDYAPADYYLALCKARLREPDQAVSLFKAALAKEPDATKREDYGKEFQKVMAQAGQDKDAYAIAPDRDAAFRILAAEALKGYQVEGLKQLVAAHAKEHAADPLLPLYQAEVYVREGRYALAEKTFAAALAKPYDEETLKPFRASRVLARYHTGQALSAYREIGPRQETFVQLAAIAFYEEDDAQLQTLLDAHAKNDPESIDLLSYRSRLLVRQDRMPEGVALFKAVLAKPLSDEKRTQLISAFLGDLWGAGKTVEGYRAAPDARQAFNLLTDDMDEEGEYADLPQLVEAHRERDPADPLLAYYQGQVHLDAKAWDKAAQVLGEGLKKAPEDRRDRYRRQYVYAMFKADRGLEAYREAEPKDKTFGQLAALMAADKKATELVDLIEAYRPNGGDDPELYFYEALSRILMKRPAEATAFLLKAYQKQPLDYLRKGYAHRYVLAMADAGQMLEGYGAAPDASAAFFALAANLVFTKKDKELATLLEEHAKAHAGEPLHRFYTGELYLLRGDAKAAVPEFVAAKAKSPPLEQWRYRNGLFRARVKAGEAAAAYREAGPESNPFEELATVCVTDKDAKQLQALIDAHRKARPDDANLPVWEMEVAWLNQDYESVLKQLDDHREDVFALPRHRWKADDYRVRSLVKLKRPQDAVREAEAVTKRPAGNRMLLVLAHAAAGDVKQTLAVVEKQKPQPYFLNSLYQDADLGPLLRSEPFRAFREKYPEPMDPEGPGGTDLEEP